MYFNNNNNNNNIIIVTIKVVLKKIETRKFDFNTNYLLQRVKESSC